MTTYIQIFFFLSLFSVAFREIEAIMFESYIEMPFDIEWDEYFVQKP